MYGKIFIRGHVFLEWHLIGSESENERYTVIKAKIKRCKKKHMREPQMTHKRGETMTSNGKRGNGIKSHPHRQVRILTSF